MRGCNKCKVWTRRTRRKHSLPVPPELTDEGDCRDDPLNTAKEVLIPYALQQRLQVYHSANLYPALNCRRRAEPHMELVIRHNHRDSHGEAAI